MWRIKSANKVYEGFVGHNLELWDGEVVLTLNPKKPTKLPRVNYWPGIQGLFVGWILVDLAASITPLFVLGMAILAMTFLFFVACFVLSLCVPSKSTILYKDIVSVETVGDDRRVVLEDGGCFVVSGDDYSELEKATV